MEIVYNGKKLRDLSGGLVVITPDGNIGMTISGDEHSIINLDTGKIEHIGGGSQVRILLNVKLMIGN